MALVIKAKTNPKLIYSYINSQKKIKDSIQSLENDSGILITDRLGITNLLNNQFHKVFSTPIKDAIFPNLTINAPPCDIIPEVVFSCEAVKKILNKLNITKSPGGDGLHPLILKVCSDSFSIHLSYIFIESFKNSEVPAQWKCASICPIYKNKGKKTDPSSYRPISLTVLPCKSMESLVKEVMSQHLETHNLINSNQHGFVKHKSCVTNLLEALDMISEVIHRGFSIDLIFLDFAKAFDMVSHDGLLHKLKFYGFSNNIINWISAFLKGRKQKVVLGDVESDWKDVLSGVPQGSVLGPLLFIVYINDMPTLLTHVCKLFADDSKLIGLICNKQDSINLQSDIDLLVQWAQDWSMLFNDEKCKVMYIGNKKRTKHIYSIKSSTNLVPHILQETPAEKDLGVYISNNLKWRTQVDHAVQKANSVLGSLKRSFSCWTKISLKILYTVFVRPHLEYANTVWCPYLKHDIRALERVQRRATKLVPELKYLDYSTRLKLLGLTTLKSRRERGDLIQYYKLVNKVNIIDWFHPNALTNSLLSSGPASGTRGHNLRLKGQLIRNCPARANYFTNRIVNSWNSLPLEVISAECVNTFKNRYDKYKNNLEMRIVSESGQTH